MSEEKGIKRAWNSIKYWWAFEGGMEMCMTAGLTLIGFEMGYLAGYAEGCSRLSKISDSIVDRSVATTIETMKLMNDISKEDSK